MGHNLKLKRCPVCGKMPKINRDRSYESMTLGSWCIIQCKPFLRKPHLKIEAGASSWEQALKKAFVVWNNMCLCREVRK